MHFSHHKPDDPCRLACQSHGKPWPPTLFDPGGVGRRQRSSQKSYDVVYSSYHPHVLSLVIYSSSFGLFNRAPNNWKSCCHSRDPSHTSFEGFPRAFNVAPTTCPSGPHPFSPPTASCPCMSRLSYHCPTRLHSWQSRRRPCPGHSSGSPQTHPVSRRP